ncbi:MAG: LysR substrate-binding domain-containing protein [Pseudomonadota bacterium]
MPDTPLPPLNALRAFDAAGRHLNFRLAATELRVTQGAVAQHVRALEKHLGVTLFERRPKGVALTQMGHEYHANIAHAFDLMRKATAQVRPLPQKVIISVTPTFASKWLIPHLPAFSARHPDVDLRVLATEQMSSFASDGIDLAVRQTAPPFGASLQAWPLFASEVIAVAAPDLANKGLEAAPKLHDTHDLWPAFWRALGRDGAEDRGMRFSQTALAIDAAIAGQGIALASRFLVEHDLAAGRLAQVTDLVIEEPSEFYLLAKRNRKRTPHVDHVIDWILQEAAQAPVR